LQNPKKAHKSNEAAAAVTVKRQRNAHHRRKADRHHDIYTHVTEKQRDEKRVVNRELMASSIDDDGLDDNDDVVE